MVLVRPRKHRLGPLALFGLLLFPWTVGLHPQDRPDQTASPAALKVQEARQALQKSDLSGALELLREALGLARGESGRRDALAVHSLMGDVYARQFQAEAAIQSYQRARVLAGELGDQEASFGLLGKLGSAHGLRGEYEEAVSFHKQALAAAGGDAEKKERVLTDIGLAHYYAGQFELAVASYDRAIDLARQLGQRGHEGFIQVNRGEVFRRVHDYGKAREAYLRAEAFAAGIGNKNLEWAAVRSLANVAFETEALDEALKHNLRALELTRELGSQEGLAGTLNALGKVHLKRGERDKARDFLDRSRALYAEAGSLNVMHPLNYLGDLSAQEKDFNQALAFYRNSLERAESGNVFNYRIDLNAKIAGVLEAQGDFRASLEHYLRAIDEIESVRGQAGGDVYRTGFLRGYYEVFEAAVALLMKMHRLEPSAGFDRQAFASSEKSKARSFLDGLQEARLDLTAGLSPALRREKLDVARRLTRALTALQRPGLTEAARLELRADLGAAEADYDRFLSRARSESPAFTAFTSTKPHDLPGIQSRLLAPRTLLVEYFLGEDASWAFVLTRDGLRVHELPAARRLEADVENFILVLKSTSGREYEQPGRRLAALLLPELRGPGAGEFDRLVIIPDGKLHFLPFEALLLPGDGPEKRGTARFVAEQFKVSYAPSASLLIDLGERKKAASFRKDLLGFGDPLVRTEPEAPGAESRESALVYRESYLERGFDLPRLAYSGLEMKAIARLFSPSRERIYLRAEATEDNFKRSGLADFKIIHLAAHGLLDEGDGARSAVVLSQDEDPGEDGFLLAREIYELKLEADLVVLSSCQTARGNLERGEGVYGLTRAFLFAGARSVLGSLWRVEDKSASEFMSLFYRGIASGSDKGEALRQARVRMLRSGRRHPSAWAAFILIGEGEGRIPVARPSLWQQLFRII